MLPGHSSIDLPLHFKISSVWGGQEGSLLFWAWILTVYSALVIIQNRNKHRAMMPYVTAVLTGTSLFFTAMHLFVANPFKLGGIQMPGGAVSLFRPNDGAGLNPLLQDTLMVIHPPMLYAGMVGLAVPYAFAIAALITRQLGDTWIRTTRRWTMATWGILGIGILLGGNWAYHELGWGGFWAWDPVENASLMPWLIGTAFLHSVMVQEKKGMLKVWNVVLIVAAYTMSIFGTTLTRSGLVDSVHAFAKSDIGGYFMAFIVVTLSGARVPDSGPAALFETRQPDGLGCIARKQLHVQQPRAAGFVLCRFSGARCSPSFPSGTTATRSPSERRSSTGSMFRSRSSCCS